MTEQGRETQPIPADRQIAEHGAIDAVPGSTSPNTPGAQADQLYGGYTGVRVGEMGRTINRLHAEGKHDEAEALAEQLRSVAPADHTPSN